MRTATLKTRMLKTALVGTVKLPTPADRIGSGFVGDIDYHPTAILSQGLNPKPRLPESEPRSRQEVLDAMSMPPAGDPNGPAGRSPGQLRCPVLLAACWRSCRASASRTLRPWSRDVHHDATPKQVRPTATRTAAVG